MLDTIYTLEAMNTDVFVIRDSEAGMPEFLIDHVAPHVSVISAGEAHLSHPTQGLLDMLTIRTHKRRFAGLKVAIVGDVKHSRVARSAATALATLGTTDLRLVAPEALLPEEAEFRGAQRFTRIEDGIAGADVIMMLRIQKERMAAAASLDDAAYFQEYGLTQKRVKLASPSVAGDASGPHEPRRGNRLRSGRWSALRDSRTGQQRRRRTHGRAGLDRRHVDAASPTPLVQPLVSAASPAASGCRSCLSRSFRCQGKGNAPHKAADPWRRSG